MGAIYKKELRSYFNNMLGYVSIAFLLVLVGLMTSMINFIQLYANFEYAIQNVGFILLLLTPLITMNSLAAERRNKTDQLLYTSPMPLAKIMIGKYLAMLTVLAIPMAVICLYPLILVGYGAANVATGYVAILGFFFLGAALLGVGMFISALTENQIIAAVVTIAVLLLMYYMSAVTSVIKDSAVASLVAFTVVAVLIWLLCRHMTKNKVFSICVAAGIEVILVALYFIAPNVLAGGLTSVLSCLAVFDRMSSLYAGVFDLTALFYYLSIIVLTVFLCVRVVEKRRWS